MAKVHLDKIETLSMNERWGVIVAMERQATVTGLTGTTWETLYDVLDEAGVPTKGSYLDNDRGSHLIVTDRNVRMVDQDKALVDIVYGKFNDRGQRLFWDPTEVSVRNMSGKMTASVVQKETNLYRPDGTGEQTEITVEHTYPSDDPDYANRTITQSGVITVMMPGRTMTVQGLKNLLSPWVLAENLIGSVNKKTWLGQPPHTWMCTEVMWEFRDEGNYFMEFQFQHDPDTWNPTVVFIDDRTGRPPEGLVEGTGYKNIRYHREVDFVQKLGFKIIGPAQ